VSPTCKSDTQIYIMGVWWQFFPSGIVLETIFPDGVVFKLFSRGDTFLRKLHGLTKQTAIANGEFTARSQVTGKPPPPLASSSQVELATTTGESASGFTNRWFDWRLTSGRLQARFQW